MPVPAIPLVTGKDNPILRTVSKKIPKMTKGIKRLIEQMHVTVRKERGVGLAAPQVGYNLQLALAQISGTFLVMMNPEILEYSEKMLPMDEGCLSLPGEWGEVKRYASLTVQFRDEKWRLRKLHLTDFNARVVQHEVDHLNARLYIDRIAEQKRLN